MGSGSGATNYGTQPTSATQPTSVANSFLGNRALSNGAAIPTSPGSSFAQLSAQGSLPGLTGSLIGNNGMPQLPKAWTPTPYVPPVAPASAANNATPPNLYYSGTNVRSGESPKNPDGTLKFKINSIHGR